MPIVTAEEVTLALGHLPLLDRVNLRLEAGERVGLIGRNGTGKSTLLKVLSEELPPDSGSVWRAPGLRISRLDQDVPLATGRRVFEEVADGLGELGDLVARYHATAVLVSESGSDALLAQLGNLQHELEEKNGWRLEQRVEMVLSRLRLPAGRPIGELSGGWRRRVLLARALVSEPDLLLLDEPTNHLDIEAIEWLEQYLLEFPGALLFVTHDRALVDRLSTRIIDLDRGALTSWPGSYSTYLTRKAEALDAEAVQQARFDKKLAQEEAWIRQGIKARRTRNEGRVHALEAMRAERARRRNHVGQVRLDLDAREASGAVVFDAEDVSKAYAGVPIVTQFSQRVMRGDRVGLIGPNGAGKTTWLRLLLGEIEPDAGTITRGSRVEVAYYDQQREQLDPEKSVADTVNDGNDTVVVNGRSRHVVGYLRDFLFPPDRMQAPVKALSGGERNRLLLARLFARPANVLVLDEPTNDLDIETLELLEELIASFEGTVLLVSHDRVFLDRIVTSTVAFEGEGRVAEYVGGYADWVRQRNQSAASPPAMTSGASRSRSAGVMPSNTPVESSSRVRLTFKEQRELERLPGRIEALETEQAALEQEAGGPDFYREPRERIEQVLSRLAETAAQLEAAYERWHNLESRR